MLGTFWADTMKDRFSLDPTSARTSTCAMEENNTDFQYLSLKTRIYPYHKAQLLIATQLTLAMFRAEEMSTWKVIVLP